MQYVNFFIGMFQQLESLCWHRNGREFMSSHADGSYVHWVVDEGNQPKEETTPYGKCTPCFISDIPSYTFFTCVLCHCLSSLFLSFIMYTVVSDF